MSRNTLLVWLVSLAVVDVVIPIPILAITLVVVVLRRPAWFLDLVRAVYGPDAVPAGEDAA